MTEAMPFLPKSNITFFMTLALGPGVFFVYRNA